MNQPIISRDVVAQQLAISPKVLIRYEEMGLIRCVSRGDVQGYEPSQVRRIWSIASYQRDLGINLAGVEMILQLRDRMSSLHHHLKDLAERLHELVDVPQPPEPPR
jgi:MerR family transcriptional regulator/heat shock protein HspR